MPGAHEAANGTTFDVKLCRRGGRLDSEIARGGVFNRDHEPGPQPADRIIVAAVRARGKNPTVRAGDDRFHKGDAVEGEAASDADVLNDPACHTTHFIMISIVSCCLSLVPVLDIERSFGLPALVVLLLLQPAHD